MDGKDIFDGKRKLCLGVFFQLMRYDILTMLRGVAAAAGSAGGSPGSAHAGGGPLPTDADIIALANARVAAAGRPSRIASFQDASLANGRFLLDLLAAQGAGVNWALVSEESTPAACEANAKYVISVARKAGASVFNVWDDITTLKPKMLLTLTASILALKTG